MKTKEQLEKKYQTINALARKYCTNLVVTEAHYVEQIYNMGELVKFVKPPQERYNANSEYGGGITGWDYIYVCQGRPKGELRARSISAGVKRALRKEIKVLHSQIEAEYYNN